MKKKHPRKKTIRIRKAGGRLNIDEEIVFCPHLQEKMKNTIFEVSVVSEEDSKNATNM